MTTSRRLAPLPLLLIGLAVLCAVLMNVPWVVHAQTPVNQNATGRPVILASAEGAGILFADTEDIADGNGLPVSGTSFTTYTWTYQWIRGRRQLPDQRGRQLGQLPARRSRCRQADKGESLVQGREQLLGDHDQPAVRPNRRTGRPVGDPVDAGQQHRPVALGQGGHHPAVRPGLQAGGPRPRLRNLQRLDRAGRSPVQSDRLPVERRC